MIKLKAQKCRWGRIGDVSGGFHIGFAIDWEPWLITLSLSVGLWSLELLIQIPFSEQRRDRLLKKIG